MLEKAANLIAYPTEFLLHAEDRTVAGLWIGKPSARRLPLNIGDEELFDAIIGTLNQSEINVPHPANFSETSKIFFMGIGKKTNKAYMTDARLVSICDVGNSYTLMPHINGGLKGPNRGFTPLSEKERKLSKNIGASEFCDTLHLAIADCR